MIGALDFRPRRRRRAVINITSLIDVLFLLLIFFMVSSTFLEQPAIELELPEAQSAEGTGVEAPSTVTVTADGEILLDGEGIDIPALTARFHAMATTDPETQLLLRADEGAAYGRVIAVVDAARSAGIHRLAAFTESPEG